MTCDMVTIWLIINSNDSNSNNILCQIQNSKCILLHILEYVEWPPFWERAAHKNDQLFALVLVISQQDIGKACINSWFLLIFHFRICCNSVNMLK